MTGFRSFWASCLLAPVLAFAGGGPFNTLVVVNTNSADSVELGNYYAAAHGIPAHQICPVGIDTNWGSITYTQFRNKLRDPVYSHIAANGLNNRIDFVVLCQDFPTRIEDAEGISASLFYGFKDAPRYVEEGCNLPVDTSNEFYRAERAFRSADGWNDTNGFVAFQLIASNLPTAKLVADRGAAAQSSFPPAAIYLYNLGDGPRGIRERRFPSAERSFATLPGLAASCVIAPPWWTLTDKTNVMGYHDGYGNLTAGAKSTNNVWLPGAYADHLTSCGGMLPNPCYEQSTVLQWMGVGATASFGTVDEPCAFLEKFPDPIMGFYYARGFSIGEAYAMSVEAPYQGLFAGDPLAAPFAAPSETTVLSHDPYQIVTGTVPVQVSASAHSNGVPAAAIDLYVDGRFQTNFAAVGPMPSNVLSVVVGTRTNSALVPTNPTLFNAVAALADAVNADANQIVFARARGDRLELIYKYYDHAGDNVPVSASVSQGAADELTLGVGLAATNLAPSSYPARQEIWLSARTVSGANAGDTVTNVITLTNGVAVTNVLVAAAGQSASSLLESLRAAVNANASLMATNGVQYNHFSQYPVSYGYLLARTPGPDGAGIQIDFFVNAVSNDTGLDTNATFSGFMQENGDDVRPRASVLFHATPTNGVLEATASIDTAALDDGEHVLDFIARDGSAVAAQSRLTLPLLVANTSCVLAVSSAHGAGSPAAGNHFYPPDSVLTNSVAVPAPAGGTQLVCAGWAMAGNQPLSGTGTNFAMTLTNHAELTWLWTTNYWLDTAAAAHGAVDVADAWQPAGVSTQITALPDDYYGFSAWSGDEVSADNPLDLLMDAPKTVQANFDALLATNDVPQWWLAQYGWTNDFDAAATNDAEPDGYFTWQEFVADTDPTNSASYPQMSTIETWQTNPPILTWPASTGRLYEIHWCDDLVVGEWTPLPLGLGSNAWTDTNPPPATGRYYRISPQLL